MRPLLFFAATFLLFGRASASEPAKTLDVYVTPYYFASPSADKRPVVAVARAYDAALAEGSAAGLRKVADAIELDNARITPMTLMVLAIRFYDAGLRDDSVFWFYAAKSRYMTASRVANFSDPRLAEAQSAMVSFATLAGPGINGYAFCDISRQQAIRAKAVEWVASHPYEVVFDPAIPALPGDRQQNMAQAIAEMRHQAQAETVYLKDPAKLKALAESCATWQHPTRVTAIEKPVADSTSAFARKYAHDVASLKAKGYVASPLPDGSIEITVSAKTVPPTGNEMAVVDLHDPLAAAAAKECPAGYNLTPDAAARFGIDPGGIPVMRQRGIVRCK